MSKITNGIVQGNDILGVPFKYTPIPETTVEVKNSHKMEPMYGVIHNAGSPSAGSTDTALNNYMANDDYKIWHFSVDCDSITQGFSTLRSGWHAGDGGGNGNGKGIGIEIADKGTDAEIMKSIDNAFKLMYIIDKEYPAIIWKPHQFFSPNKKNCPKWILEHWTWDGFMARYKAFVAAISTPAPDAITKLAVDMVTKGLTTDRAYWENVMRGTTAPKPAHIQTILQRAVDKIKG